MAEIGRVDRNPFLSEMVAQRLEREFHHLMGMLVSEQGPVFVDDQLWTLKAM